MKEGGRPLRFLLMSILKLMDVHGGNGGLPYTIDQRQMIP